MNPLDTVTISRFYREVKLFTIVEGACEVQHMVMARWSGCWRGI